MADRRPLVGEVSTRGRRRVAMAAAAAKTVPFPFPLLPPRPPADVGRRPRQAATRATTRRTQPRDSSTSAAAAVSNFQPYRPEPSQDRRRRRTTRVAQDAISWTRWCRGPRKAGGAQGFSAFAFAFAFPVRAPPGRAISGASRADAPRALPRGPPVRAASRAAASPFSSARRRRGAFPSPSGHGTSGRRPPRRPRGPPPRLDAADSSLATHRPLSLGSLSAGRWPRYGVRLILGAYTAAGASFDVLERPRRSSASA